MFERLRRWLLRGLRVPPEPTPPFGAPGSIRVFRAGPNYRTVLLARWGVAQVGALAGLLVSIAVVSQLHQQIELGRRAAPLPPTAPSVAPVVNPATQVQPTSRPAKSRPSARTEDLVRRAAARSPDWILPLLVAVEIVGVLLFLIQFAATLVAVRLEFDQHWYIVTDRSLRIRTGLLRVQESTMSFANLQQVAVSQGPLQRLLGLADVRVQSAGGGGHGGEQAAGGTADSLHTGVFHGVANAAEIRDLILERLRQFRAAGLGDPDDPTATPLAAAPADPLVAARELLSEATALRRTLAG